MIGERHNMQPLLTGAVPRIALAVLIILCLWAGFFWATSTPGAL